MSRESHDVFLCYNNTDRLIVEWLAQRLRQEGITPWLDTWNLIPGRPFQEGIEEALQQCASCAVFVGASGVGPWQNEQMRAAIGRRVQDSRDNEKKEYRVIPVLLPGGQREPRTRLPDFLTAATWVEFRTSVETDDDALHRLQCGIRGIAPGPGSSVQSGECPYPGLRPFDVGDAPFFFGREAGVQWLLNRLRPAGGPRDENRFLGIVGASGSGKSSLARAGLLSALEKNRLNGSGTWPQVICRPGENPLESLAIALDADPRIGSSIKDVGDLIERFGNQETRLHLTIGRALHNSSDEGRAVLLVDQFEELFTLCNNETCRQAFIDNLLYASSVAQGKTIVILTMRVDFLGRCTAFRSLTAALSDELELVPPMSEGELRQAIEHPAQLARCELEPGLIKVLLQDVKGQSGALPLLQHALRELWERRQGGRRLTIEAYEEIGGVNGALERRANETFERLDTHQQKICRRIFLRLTKLGEGTEDTKRRVNRGELLPTDEDAEAVETVIRRLADERLVTTSGGSDPESSTVEVAHEALIRGWSKLRQWLDDNRESLRTHEHLREASRQWEEHDREEGYLYRGAPLLAAEQCSRESAALMTRLDQDFLDASVGRLVQTLATAEAGQLIEAINELTPFAHRAHAFLSQLLQESTVDSRERLHASLALLPSDLGQLDFLCERLLLADLADFVVMIDQLSAHRDRLIEPLWQELNDEANDDDRRFHAAMALAVYDPPIDDAGTSPWQQRAAFVAGQLVDRLAWNPSQFALLTNSLRPIRQVLLGPLHERLRAEEDAAKRSWVANLLADYAADDPERLVDLICDANADDFAILFAKLRLHHDQAQAAAEAEIARPVPGAASETEKETLAQRQANAAVALLRLGQPARVWPLLKHSPDPRRRSYLVHRLSPLGADLEVILNQLDVEPDASIRRALILSLGEFPRVAAGEHPVVQKLLNVFRDDPDPGVHAASEWTLRRWQQDEALSESTARPADPDGDRRWYVTREGHTLVVLPGPTEFEMGSSEAEEGRRFDETSHRRRIGYAVAMASKPVTVGQFLRFQNENSHIQTFDVGTYAPDPHCPQLAVDWYDAVAYCNWLSDKEGIPREEWCYQPKRFRGYAEGMRPARDYLLRIGYRLPTEAEWEYSCRAQTETSRYYGSSEALLDNYVWYLRNAGDRAWPVGSLKPNDFGLFDMLGNVFEWCHERYHEYRIDEPSMPVGETEDMSKVRDRESRVLRGGSFLKAAHDARSAYRANYQPVNRYFNVGFRVARTYP